MLRRGQSPWERIAGVNSMDPPQHADDARLSSAAAERNRVPIAAVLARYLPGSGRVLEIASGTGQHAVHFAQSFPHLVWQPSDPDEACCRSIAAWRRSAALGNLLEPLPLDVLEQPWPCDAADAVVCINLIHIAPWRAALALFEGAAQVLGAGDLLFLYGPYRIRGRHFAASNAEFDDALRARNPEWGVRDLDEVTAAAAQWAFEPEAIVSMPANNSSVVLRLGRAVT